MQPDDVYLPEVLIEMRRVGNSIRVAAIDPVSGTEVTMVVPHKANISDIKQIAVRKLTYVLGKKQAAEKEAQS